MGCRTLELNDGRAVLHDSVTEVVFGPIFDSEEDADLFVLAVIAKTGKDPRALDHEALADAHCDWVRGVY